MNKTLGIARCGLACCLCSENTRCAGCRADGCAGKEWCENRRCSTARSINACYECDADDCRKGLLGKTKPYAFTQFVRRYDVDELLLCLERNEANGVVYHREGIRGDYDGFDDVEELIGFIKTGVR